MPQDESYYEPKSRKTFKPGDYQVRQNVARPKGGYILYDFNSKDDMDTAPFRPRKRRTGGGRRAKPQGRKRTR